MSDDQFSGGGLSAIGDLGIGLAGGLFAFSIWIAAQAATPHGPPLLSDCDDFSATDAETPAATTSAKTTNAKSSATVSLPASRDVKRGHAEELGRSSSHAFRPGDDGEWCAGCISM